MYKQLSPWLLQGILMDSYSEFFIHKEKKVKSLAAAAHNQDDELGIGGITGQQLQKIQVSISTINLFSVILGVK